MGNLLDLKKMLNQTVEKYGDKIAYQIDNKEISYHKLLEDVNCLGTKLIDMGLKGKNIAILSENRYEWEMSYLAITCGTGIVIPIDRSFTKIEIGRIIERAEIDVVICSKEYEEILKDLKLKYIISMDLESTNKTVFSEKQLMEEGRKLIEKGNRNFIDARINSEDMGFVYFTSGTTNDSKAVMLSHKNVCSNLINSADFFDITSKDIVLSVLPLNHVLEGLFCFLVSLYKGAKRIYGGEIKDVIKDIEKYHITFVAGVPALYELMYQELLENQTYKKINSQINVLFSGGAPLSSKLKQDYKELGIDLIQGYGLTETSPVVALETKNKQKNETVGLVIPGIKTKLEKVQEDGVGKLLIKSDSVMIGYYKNDSASQTATMEGWFDTGDLAKIDEEGYLYICGREKDVIVLKNGKKILPEELEKILETIKGVKEVFVFGKEVIHLKEDIKLYAEIVYDKNEFYGKTENEIEVYMEEEVKNININLPEYKNVKGILLTETPIGRNSNGKIKRNEEREKIKKNSSNVKEEPNEKNQNSMEEKIKDILSEQLDVQKGKININSHLLLDLGADSLDKVEIILKLEKNFGVKITKEESKNIQEFKDIVNLIKLKQ